jgi:hypothetical protein
MESKELESLLQILRMVPLSDYKLKADILHAVQKSIITIPVLQDVFRHVNGFDALLEVLKCMAGVLPDHSASSSELVLWRVMELLHSTIAGNRENRRIVGSKSFVRDLANTFKSSGILASSKGFRQLCSYLFGLSIENKDTIELFCPYIGEMEEQLVNREAELLATPKLLQVITAPTTIAHNPWALAVILDLTVNVVSEAFTTPKAILQLVDKFSKANTWNQVLLSDSEILSMLFEWQLDDIKATWFLKPDATNELMEPLELATMEDTGRIIKELTSRLVELGMNEQHLQALLQQAKPLLLPQGETESLQPKQMQLIDILLQSLQVGRVPNYLHFDTNISSLCSIYIPDSGRSFPPVSGYSFMIWFQVVKFDSKIDIPLLYMEDMEDKIRLAVFVEAASKCIRIQTYKTTVQFGNFHVQENTWYNMVIVHQKPRITASSLDIYINGELLERVKCGYLGHPGTVSLSQ